MARNTQGECVCPENKPIWTGQSCIPRATPQQVQPEQCPANQVRNPQGQCQCPPNLPVWTGQFCIPRVVPAPLTCPPGYTAYRNKDRIPANSDVVRRQSGSQVLFCAKPRPAQQSGCPSGWTQVSRSKAKALVQQGYQIQEVGSILCAKPRQQTTPQTTTPQTTQPQTTGPQKITPQLRRRIPLQ
jgi:hypothetical protein